MVKQENQTTEELLFEQVVITHGQATYARALANINAGRRRTDESEQLHHELENACNSLEGALSIIDYIRSIKIHYET